MDQVVSRLRCQPKYIVASTAATSCTVTKTATFAGLIPAKVSVNPRAIVTAGLANDVDEIGLAQSTTSEHLRILKAAGIITGEVEPPRVCYSLDVTALEPFIDFLEIIANRVPSTHV